jgi:hypothetical protein
LHEAIPDIIFKSLYNRKTPHYLILESTIGLALMAKLGFIHRKQVKVGLVQTLINILVC